MPGAIEDFDRVRFGGPTISDEATVTVATTPTRILRNDPDRLAIYMTNNNAMDVFWSTLPDVDAIGGFAIGDGIVTVFQVQNDGALCGRELWAVAPAGPADIQILTLRRQSRG
jgi:hypothetical protein